MSTTRKELTRELTAICICHRTRPYLGFILSSTTGFFHSNYNLIGVMRGERRKESGSGGCELERSTFKLEHAKKKRKNKDTFSLSRLFI